MTTTSSRAFLTRIERLRRLDPASFDAEVMAAKPLWLAMAATPEAAGAAPHDARTASTSGNDGPARSPQVPH